MDGISSKSSLRGDRIGEYWANVRLDRAISVFIAVPVSSRVVFSPRCSLLCRRGSPLGDIHKTFHALSAVFEEISRNNFFGRRSESPDDAGSD